MQPESAKSAWADTGALWHVNALDRHQRVEPHQKYWWDNTHREQAGTVVFQYTLAGRIIYRDATGTHDVPAGSAVLFAYAEKSAYGLPPGAREPYECHWLSVRGAGLMEHIRPLRERHGSVIRVHPDVLDAFLRLLDSADPRSATPPTEMAARVHEWVMSLHSSLHQTLLCSQTPVEQAVEDLLRNPSYPWSLKQLTEHYGISREHFSRVFSRRVGLAPGAWLSQARLRKVELLLRETQLSVASIAEQSGFSSTHTLARLVRQKTGLSPRAWRDKKREATRE
jgi:AraC-like DNA-binding protein